MSRHYIAAAQSDVGIVKNVNQDSLGLRLADTHNGEAVFVVLCDGMGGLSQGEVASAHVVLAFNEWFENECIDLLENGLDQQELRHSWEKIIYKCNDDIVRYGQQLSTNAGTTLTVLLIFQGRYYIAHVGDCRAYELGANNVLKQITTDQTYVAREVSLGRMTSEQAKTDPRRNVLLQCIGVNHIVQPDFIVGDADNLSFLLCSDGFRHEIAPQEIYTCCYTNLEAYMGKDDETIEQAMNQQLAYLIELNKSRNERDNITAVLISPVNR